MAKKKVVKKTVARKPQEDYTGLFIPAGVLLGIGLGITFGNAGSGALIGLGCGFLLMALVKSLKK